MSSTVKVPSVDDQQEQIRELTERTRQQAEELKEKAARIKQLEEKTQALEGEVKGLEEEVEDLKRLLAGKALSKTAKKPSFQQNYSLERNPLRKRRRRGKHSTGRRPLEQKRKLVSSELDIYHPGADPKQCVLHREQLAWRLVGGQAVYVAYRIFDRPDSKALPLPPGVRTSRSEFGLEIILILAFLHYWIGLSLDHACEVMGFFTKLQLSKSQADSLLTQLSCDWDEQYDAIAELIALQLIVYIDETGWKVGAKSCYTWIFSTTMHVLFRCGVSREKSEAQAVLGEAFAGIGVSDDYAAYKSLFSEHQLCWAHLIRKAIKLALQHPKESAYARFLDGLCEIYHQGLRYQRDGRLSASRAQKAGELLERVRQLCTRHGEKITSETPEHLDCFIHLQNELMGNLECLFVFVEHPEVEATNNRSERNVRHEAEIRKGARTSKTAIGARRRSVILTVLSSLATRFERFTLDNLLAEVSRWWQSGISIFEQELAGLQPNAPPNSS